MNEYIRSVRNKDNLAFAIKVDGKELSVVVQSYESQAVTGKLLHVDLMVAQAGLQTTYNVPVVAVGEAVGLKNQGLLHIAKPRLRVKAAIENLPNTIEIDVTKMDVGNSKLVRDLDAIPNVTILDSDRVALISIIKAK